MKNHRKGVFVYLLSILIVLVYLCLIYYLRISHKIETKDFINNFTAFLGWILALLIGFIHLQKSREDSKLAKIEETRKTLEIDAFREINKATKEFASTLSTVAVPYVTLPNKLKVHIEFPSTLIFNKAKIEPELRQKYLLLRRGLIDFVLAIESNEIAVIEYDHYRKYIQFKVDDVHEVIDSFLDYFNRITTDVLLTKEGLDNFEKRSWAVYEALTDIQMYLIDYRVILMNSLLGEVFNKVVPMRRPRDPKYKTLKEVAIKEQVAAEEEARELRAMNRHNN